MIPNQKHRGFSLVELVVGILIISVLSGALFMGGATVIDEARTKTVMNALKSIDSAAELALSENSYVVSIKDTALGTDERTGMKTAFQRFMIAFDNELPDDMKLVSTEIQANPTSDIIRLSVDTESKQYAIFQSSKEDPWGHPYYIIVDTVGRYIDGKHSALYITAISAGPNGFADIGGNIDVDDLFMLLQYVDGNIDASYYDCSKIYGFESDDSATFLSLYDMSGEEGSYQQAGGDPSSSWGSSWVKANYTKPGYTLTATTNTKTQSEKANSDTATLVRLQVTSKPTKMNYYEGESFSSVGMVVKGTFSDGSKKNVLFTVEDGEELSTTNQKVTISSTYGENTVTLEYPINVYSRDPSVLIFSNGEMVFQMGALPKNTSRSRELVAFWSNFHLQEYNDEFIAQEVGAEYNPVPWDSYKSTIKTVVFDESFKSAKPVSMQVWFFGFENLKEVKNAQNIDTSEVKSMRSLFNGCKKLQTVDVSSWDTSNVTNMKSVFKDCYLLSVIDVSNFNTSKVTNMAHMFRNCITVTTLNVSNFDTSNVTDMQYMFASDDDTSYSHSVGGGVSYDQVTKYTGVRVKSLDVSRWDTSKVTNMNHMFRYCADLTSIDVSHWDTSSVTDMSNMFWCAFGLKTIPVENWDTSNVTSIGGMFGGFGGKDMGLTELDLSKWNTKNITSIATIFQRCGNLKTMGDCSNWDTSKVKYFGWAFNGCAITDYSFIENWDFSSVEDIDHMFQGTRCTSEITLNALDLSHLTDQNGLSGMFRSSKFTGLNLLNWNTTGVKMFREMFFACANLRYINGIETFDTSSATDFYAMFDQSPLLETLDLSAWDVSNVTNFEYCFYLDNSLKYLDISTWKPESATSFYVMFQGMKSIEELDLSAFSTPNLVNTSRMFADCTSLKTIYTSEDFNVENVTSSWDMFSNCPLLVGGNGTVYDSNKKDKTYANIDTKAKYGYFTAKAD